MAARNAGSARIAEALATEMEARGLSRADILARIEASTGRRPDRQWASRTFNGGSHFTIQVPSEIPNDLLKQLASAIEPDQQAAHRLAVRLGLLAVQENIPEDDGADLGQPVA